jgi:hypothetical protein
MKSSAGKKKAKAIEEFSLNYVVFPSLPDTGFRVSHQMNPDEGSHEIRCENRTTHQQWQAAVKDISDIAPEDLKIPFPVILNYFYQALVNNNNDEKSETESSKSAAASSANCSIDMENCNGGINLVLTVEITEFWCPEFTFNLLPVGLDRTDLLESQLRDAQEEIIKLKKSHKEILRLAKEEVNQLRAQSQTAYLSVGCNEAIANNNMMTWKAPERRIINDKFFSVSDSCIDILQAGIYAVHCKCYATNGGSLSLLLNGTEISVVAQYNAYGVETCLLTEILELKANDTLQFRYKNGNGPNVTAGAICNRLIIHTLPSVI